MAEFEFGEVTGRETRKNEDNENRRFLQCVVAGEKETRMVEFISQNGEDSSPGDGASVLLIDVGGRWFAIATDDGFDPNAAVGEKHLYSYAETGLEKKAEVILRVDGSAEINGSADFAVRFNALQTLMNTLATALNTEFVKIQTAISGLGGTYVPATINIDLSTAKVATVKLP